MSLVMISGDCATTTALALTSTWPSPCDPFLIEVDPSGGSLAAWLDLPVTPSISTAVTTVDGWQDLEPLLRVSESGIRVLPAPVRTREASRSVQQSAALLAVVADAPRAVAVADAGCAAGLGTTEDLHRVADLAVVVHRQCTHSARAAAVRVERLAEHVEALEALGVQPVLAVIGSAPFQPVEIAASVLGDRPLMLTLAEDPLAAAVLAGRAGVSARRFARLPLVRTARAGAAALNEILIGNQDAAGAAAEASK
jgi:hypothetical protein